MTMTLQRPLRGIPLRFPRFSLPGFLFGWLTRRPDSYYEAQGKSDAAFTLNAACKCLEPFTDAPHLDDPVVVASTCTDDEEQFPLRYAHKAYLKTVCADLNGSCRHKDWKFHRRRHTNGTDWEIYAQSDR